MIEVVKSGHNGIRLPDYGISLDHKGANGDYVIASHAHSDHIPRGADHIYATPPTADFMLERGFKGEITRLEYEKPVEIDDLTFRLYPAGHILGSALTYIETREGSILYTGDYRYPSAEGTEGCEIPEPVDFLITEATFGLPIYRWKSRGELNHKIVSFAEKQLSDGYTPLFLAYNLGKAQETMHILSDTELPVQIHGGGYKFCPIYEKYNVDLGNVKPYTAETAEGHVLIAPVSAFNSGFASHVRQKKIAYCSGWAALESRRTQLTVDKLIPLSDHIDFFELINLCERLNPRNVFITHTPDSTVLEHYLSERNISSQFLDKNSQ